MGDDHGVALGAERDQLVDALSVQARFAPGYVGEEILQLLHARSRHDLGYSVTVLVKAFGQEAAHVSLQQRGTRALQEVHREGTVVRLWYEAQAAETSA